MRFVVDSDSFKQLVDSELNRVAADMFSKSQENLIKNGSVDTGEVLKTANINSKFLEKEIVYPAQHSSYIEYGTHPHFMGRKGITALQGWAQRKLGKNEKEAKSMAFAIAKTIEKEGMTARPFLRSALEAVIEGIA